MIRFYYTNIDKKAMPPCSRGDVYVNKKRSVGASNEISRARDPNMLFTYYTSRECMQ